MQQLKLLITLILVFGWISSAQAELYFEPYIGYGYGTIKENSTTSGSTSNTYDSSTIIWPSLSAKFGFFYDYIYLVADGRYSVIHTKEQTTESSIPLVNMGVGIGIDFNIPIRLFYILDTSANITVNDRATKATGSRLSIGYYINLEALISVEMMNATASIENGSTTIESKISGALLTVSFPFEFLYPRTSWKEKARQ